MAVLALGAMPLAQPAQAQSVIASVNDDPITDVDVSQHMKLLAVLKKPATRDAAIENIISVRLKLIEGAKFKLKLSDSDIGPTIGLTARKLKIPPQALLQNLQHAGVTEDQWKQYFTAEAGWGIYIRALNKTLEISETEMRNAGANKDAGKKTVNEYVLRQVIMIVPNNASGSVVETRMREAQQLRQRFTDCNTGVALGRGMQDVAIKEPTTRTGTALNDQLRNLLDTMEVGHLTPPQRGQTGIDMIALCSRGVAREEKAGADDLRCELLMAKLEKESDRLFKDVRNRAIIVKR